MMKMQDISQLLSRCRTAEKILLGLDRDGTLIPVEKDPDKSVMTSEVRDLLSELARVPNLHVVVISARGNIRLSADALAPEIILAGNYGMEMRLQDGQERVIPEASRAVSELRQLQAQLKSIASEFEGIILEDDYYSFCLHWDLVAVERRAVLEALLKRSVENLTTVHMRNLTTSYEFMPNVNWDKGQALEALSSLPGFSDPVPYFIYIGDAGSDEPAFEWVNKREGGSVKVGPLSESSMARFRLEHPKAVISFLKQLLSDFEAR